MSYKREMLRDKVRIDRNCRFDEWTRVERTTGCRMYRASRWYNERKTRRNRSIDRDRRRVPTMPIAISQAWHVTRHHTWIIPFCSSIGIAYTLARRSTLLHLNASTGCFPRRTPTTPLLLRRAWNIAPFMLRGIQFRIQCGRRPWSVSQS